MSFPRYTPQWLPLSLSMAIVPDKKEEKMEISVAEMVNTVVEIKLNDELLNKPLEEIENLESKNTSAKEEVKMSN